MADAILVTGASGVVGEALVRRLLADRGREVVVLTRRPDLARAGARPLAVDLADEPATIDAVLALRPRAIVHLAAMTRIDDCAADPARARVVNVRATTVLAELAAGMGAGFVLGSTDLVFDGRHAPYREADVPAPLSEYGRTKAAAELAVRAASDRHLVCRMSLVYGPCRGALRQLDWILDKARRGEPVELFADEWRTPIDSVSLADALCELVDTEAQGVLHLGGADRVDRLDFGRRLLARAGLDPGLARAASRADHAERPADVSLDSTRARSTLVAPLPGLDEGLERVWAAHARA